MAQRPLSQQRANIRRRRRIYRERESQRLERKAFKQSLTSTPTIYVLESFTVNIIDIFYEYDATLDMCYFGWVRDNIHYYTPTAPKMQLE